MPVRHHIDTEEQLANFLQMRNQMLLAGKRVCVEFVGGPGSRTSAQNASLHLWLRQLSEVLNLAGLDMRHVIKEEIDIPWTTESAKEYLWRPVQKAMTGKESTTEPNKLEYPEISDAISRHLSQKFGITPPPWPEAEQ